MGLKACFSFFLYAVFRSYSSSKEELSDCLLQIRQEGWKYGNWVFFLISMTKILDRNNLKEEFISSEKSQVVGYRGVGKGRGTGNCQGAQTFSFPPLRSQDFTSLYGQGREGE